MTDKTSGHISPNIDVQKDGSKAAYQQQLLQRNIDLMHTAADDYDNKLASILESALDLSRLREAAISTLLSADSTIHDKLKAYDTLEALKTRAHMIIRAGLANRFLKEGLITLEAEIYDLLELVEVFGTQGYFHYINPETKRDYRAEPLTSEEVLRSLEPSTIVRAKNVDSVKLAGVIHGLSELGMLLSQYSIIISSDKVDYTPEEIGESIVLEESGLKAPMLKSAIHSYDLAIDVIDVPIGEATLEQSPDLYHDIARILAVYSFAGCTFEGTKMELYYIQDYDPPRRDYITWKHDLEVACRDIAERVTLYINKKYGKDYRPAMLPESVENGEPRNVLVVYTGDEPDAYPNFCDYPTLTSKAQAARVLREKLAHYLL